MDALSERERLVDHLKALSDAAEALDRARRQFPDPGLDHAIDRLSRQTAQFAARLLALDDE
jgi:hypothetical protein